MNLISKVTIGKDSWLYEINRMYQYQPNKIDNKSKYETEKNWIDKYKYLAIFRKSC